MYDIQMYRKQNLLMFVPLKGETINFVTELKYFLASGSYLALSAKLTNDLVVAQCESSSELCSISDLL